jgi:hypothetical protein
VSLLAKRCTGSCASHIMKPRFWEYLSIGIVILNGEYINDRRRSPQVHRPRAVHQLHRRPGRKDFVRRHLFPSPARRAVVWIAQGVVPRLESQGRRCLPTTSNPSFPRSSRNHTSSSIKAVSFWITPIRKVIDFSNPVLFYIPSCCHPSLQFFFQTCSSPKHISERT